MNKAREPFVIAPTALIRDLSLSGGWDVRIYLEIRSYYNEEEQRPTFPSRATIAKNTGCSTDVVDRAIKRLIAAGHMVKERGCTGRTNRYQFAFRLSGNSRAGADIITATERSGGRTDAEEVTAQERHQPEPSNQRQKPVRATQLFHGRDRAYANSDGSIAIVNHASERVTYGGGDDGAFRYGNLAGSEARKAAIADAGFQRISISMASPNLSGYARG